MTLPAIRNSMAEPLRGFKPGDVYRVRWDDNRYRGEAPPPNPRAALDAFSDACRRHGLDPADYAARVRYLPESAQYELLVRLA